MNDQNQNNNNIPNTAMNFNIPNSEEQPTNQNMQTLSSVVNNIPTNEISNPQPVSEPVAPPVDTPTLASAVNNVTPVLGETSVTNNPVMPNANQEQLINEQTVPVPENMPPTNEEIIKKKTSPIVIIALALLLLVIGGGLLYYFVLDTPNKVFTVAFNNLSKNLKSEARSNNFNYTNYDLSLNISSDNEKYKDYSDIINKIKINATSGINGDNKFVLNGIVTYNDSELLNLNMLFDDNDGYIKAPNLLDKVIKFNISTENDNDSYKPDFDTNDYNQVINSSLNAIKSALDKANYKKELVSLNGARVKKSTLKIDGSFLEKIHSVLTNDELFLNSLSKITGKTTNEIIEEMNKEVNEFKNNDEEVAIYTTFLKNEFIKLVFTSDKDELTITSSGNTYNYEITENSQLTYKGYIRYNKMTTNSNLIFNVQIPDESLNVTFSCTSLAVDSLDSLDISNSIDFEKLTEEDYNSLFENIDKNQAIKTFINDLGLTEESIATITA